VDVPVTNTSPAPPPPPRLPKPPPPPPPTTATSIAETPVGVVQAQLPTPVSLWVVYPLADVVAIVQSIGVHVAVSVTFAETVPEVGKVRFAPTVLVSLDQPANV
jgi:hypothetical protein